MKLASAVIIVLVLATSALAECAWVLWMRTDDAADNSRWAIHSSYPSTKTKMALSDKSIEVDMGWTKCTKEREGLLKELASAENAAQMRKWGYKGYYAICLTDTVDPRGPKGGQK